MSILKKLKPAFLDHKDVTAGPYRHHFDFQRIWKRAILVTATVALVPLIIWALSGYRLTMETIESELELRTSQLVSNSWRSVSLFLTERRSVLDFIAHDHGLETLQNPARLAGILENLNKRFGGFLDLGVIDHSGKQISHTGSHQMEGLNFNQQAWFREVLNRGVYISELVTGPLNEPHIDFAVKRELADGSYFVLHAVLKPEQLTESIKLLPKLMWVPGEIFLLLTAMACCRPLPAITARSLKKSPSPFQSTLPRRGFSKAAMAVETESSSVTPISRIPLIS